VPAVQGLKLYQQISPTRANSINHLRAPDAAANKPPLRTIAERLRLEQSRRRSHVAARGSNIPSKPA